MYWVYAVLTVYLIVINLVAFLFCKRDKKYAQEGKTRISEGALFCLALAGGGIGLYVSMFVNRHKTKHGTFLVGIPAIVVLEVALAICIILLATQK